MKMQPFIVLTSLLAILSVGLTGCDDGAEDMAAGDSGPATSSGSSESGSSESSYKPGMRFTLDGRTVAYRPPFQSRPMIGVVRDGVVRVNEMTSLSSGKQANDGMLASFTAVLGDVEPGTYDLVGLAEYGDLPDGSAGTKVAAIEFGKTADGDSVEGTTFPQTFVSQSGTLTVESINVGPSDVEGDSAEHVKALTFTFSGTFADADGNTLEITDGTYTNASKK